MSLVSTYVRAVDGKVYENPVVCGFQLDKNHKETRLRWFLCFDDDDPPELVIELQEKNTILEVVSLPCFKRVGFFGTCGYRCFSTGTFAKAAHCFCKLVARIPVPRKFTAVFDEFPEKQGVFYDLPCSGG